MAVIDCTLPIAVDEKLRARAAKSRTASIEPDDIERDGSGRFASKGGGDTAVMEQPVAPNPGNPDVRVDDATAIFVAENMTDAARSYATREWGKAEAHLWPERTAQASREAMTERAHLAVNGAVVRAEPAVFEAIVGSGRFLSASEAPKAEGQWGGDRYNAQRADIEAERMGVARDLSPDARPIYGLTVDAGSVNYSGAYGEVMFGLTPAAIDGRTSFCNGDSLTAQMPIVPIYPDQVAGASQGRLTAASGEHGDPVTYTEVQVHGGVTMDHVAYVAVPSSSSPLNSGPPPDYRAALDAAGYGHIPVVTYPVTWDARGRQESVDLSPIHQAAGLP